MFTVTEKPEQEIKTTLFKGYRILNKDMDYQNLVSMLNVLTRAKVTMIKPLMYQFISEIDIATFQTDGFIQKLKEVFASEIRKRNKQRIKENAKARNRQIPKIEMIYGIETKPHNDNEGLYHHIHIMLVADAGHNDYGKKEIMIAVNKALSRVKGLQQVHYDDNGVIGVKDGKDNFYGLLQPRDSSSTIKHSEYLSLLCHDLKQEFNDAVIRASYLCKTTQKELLPERFKKMNFNVTRVKRNSANDNEQQSA